MKKRLNLQFKGERNYLHGTDMFNETMAFLEHHHPSSEPSTIDFSFHRMAKTALDLYDSPQSGLGEHVAECSYTIGSKRFKVYLYESGDEVSDRYPYDEEEITRDFEINVSGRYGILRTVPEYTDVEIWVALTKELHQKALPEITGKWLFVRGRFPSYVRLTQSKERSLRMISNFQNRLTRTELLLDGKRAGEIFFSVI